VQSDRIRTLEEATQVDSRPLWRLGHDASRVFEPGDGDENSGSETLRAVERDLAEARAMSAAARSASLINLVDSRRLARDR